MNTYISLFSSAGVGCFGYKMEGFECIATNEKIERRLDIQRANDKCKYDSGYICGDIQDPETVNKIYGEIDLWKRQEGLDRVTVVVATPPCQGMSTVNYKKGDETKRNSLVVEAVHIIKKIKPRIFVFENVKAFLKTNCVDKDEEQLCIGNCINKHLLSEYNIYSKVVNFKEYGVPSSRPRTIVIGTLKEEKNFTPLNLFPLKQKEVTVREAIGNYPSLEYGERDENDILHSFRTYPEYMQEWIHDLKEGESAFNNPEDMLPYKIVDGKRQILKSGHMGNKFRRMFWDQTAPCITTRNDQLASQSTIHPRDDRVLSIRELMAVMTIPREFKWVSDDDYRAEVIDSKETLIRQSIGEAVPTAIMRQIAKNIRILLEYDEFVKCGKYDIDERETNNPYIKSFVYEWKLSDAKDTGSFYTPQIVVYNAIKEYKPSQKSVRILEPSVGMGAFIPQMLRLVDDCDEVEFVCYDISQECLSRLDEFVLEMKLTPKFHFKFICEDFLLSNQPQEFDAVIANPPYYKMKAAQKKAYKNSFGFVNDNIFCLFMKKINGLAKDVMLVIPKVFLMIPDCDDTREIYSSEYGIVSIYDYGVKFFKKVFIEILSLHFSKDYTGELYIRNYVEDEEKTVKQGYIYHDTMWLLYRDKWFDRYIKKLRLGVFDFYRDRQLTNKYLSDQKKNIWVVRSKNLLDDGSIVHKPGYDKYVDSVEGFSLSRYYNTKPIIFTNFTYNTRASILPDGCTVNGSFCILLPKDHIDHVALDFYASEDFRKYYAIVKNKSKFTINVDANSIYYIGIEKENAG
ncbi:MAG: DNA cytosine methyltransferase [Eubacterium sp.]|nr:DNA cytosine methyltransferase [Eubacterium sp.]